MTKRLTVDNITDDEIRDAMARGLVPSSVGMEALSRGHLTFIADVNTAKREIIKALENKT